MKHFTAALLLIYFALIPLASSAEELASSTPEIPAQGSMDETAPAAISSESTGSGLIVILQGSINHPRTDIPQALAIQRALKPGDTFYAYIYAQSGNGEAFEGATTDFSELGFGNEVPMLPVGCGQSNKCDFRSEEFVLPSTVVAGVHHASISITDVHGQTAIKDFEIVVDSQPPTFTLVPTFTRDALVNGGTTTWSGAIDGTGSDAVTYLLKEELLASNGTRALWEIDYITGSSEGGPLREWRSGEIENVTLHLAGVSGLLASYPDAKYVRFTISVVDEANQRMTKVLPLIDVREPEKAAVSNVVFLPGIKSSRLYMRTSAGTERDLWEPTIASDIPLLAMREDGTSVNAIYTREIIDRVYEHHPVLQSAATYAMGDAINVYGPFEDFMHGLVADGTVNEWRAYPYDWRYDVIDIANNGTLVAEANETPHKVFLDAMIQELANTSATGKVTIVAHSNGGLLAKAIAMKLQAEGKIHLLDRIIMVGTPQYGTPMAIGSMLHGDNEEIANGLIVYAETARNTTKQMPGAYGLLPSAAYQANVPDAVATFDDSRATAAFRTAFGESVNSPTELKSFVTGSVPASGAVTDLRTPLVLSKALVDKAAATHAKLDAWVPPAGLEVDSIIGWGQLTPFQLGYTTRAESKCTSIFSCSVTYVLEHQALTTSNGDGTVVSRSATGGIGDTYFLNAESFGRQIGPKIYHSSLLSAEPVTATVTSLIQGKDVVSEYISTYQPSSQNVNQTVVSAHSPANIIATDGDGKETGIFPIAGLEGFYFLKKEIPGSAVQVLGAEKYLILPKGEYAVEMHGYANGTTTLEVAQGVSGKPASTTQVFPSIPTTSKTAANFTLSAQGVATTPAVDVNGDGKVDMYATSSPTTGPQTPIFTLLKERIAASKLPTILKILLTAILNDIERRKSDPRTYRTFVLDLESVLKTVQDKNLKKDREDILNLIQKIKS